MVPMSSSAGRRIGLLGGTFDPPHLGHLVAAEEARVNLDLDAVHFVVAGEPWMKRRCSPAEDRVRMVELALEGNTDFVVNRTEVDRDGPTYTVDTLEDLRSRHAQVRLFFLLGADAAARVPEWKKGERCLDLATFVALTRPGYDLDLTGPTLEQVRRLEIPAIDVSSTDLRNRFRQGRAVRYQVTRAVEAFVRDRGLYGIDTSRGTTSGVGLGSHPRRDTG